MFFSKQENLLKQKRWMIYGANGYTGELVAREAKRRELLPVLAGRSEAKISALANELRFPFKVFPLDNPADIAQNLQEVELVLHCAGPFSATAVPMVEACLLSKTHYLDITGEIEVFEYIHGQNERARQSGIVLCPGTGFDVIPTDCVAAVLKSAMPDAAHLTLGFEARAGVSAGTAKSSLEGIGKGGRIRKDGKIKSVSLNYKTSKIDFGNGKKNALSIPWGDVSTAYYTTGIPNIEVYMALPPNTDSFLKFLPLIRPILAFPPIQNFMKKRIEKKVKGPAEKLRQKFGVYVWGEVSNPAGEIKTAFLQTADGYEVTIHGSLKIVEKLLDEQLPPGSFTPSQIMGDRFISILPGSTEIRIVD
jgi:short subunit dehydrogenase-like uncharacterized protein